MNDSLTCPITFDLFRDPVVAEDGHTYEREAIINWIREKGTSPITREPLTTESLRPNYTVKKVVDEFKATKRSKNVKQRSTFTDLKHTLLQGQDELAVCKPMNRIKVHHFHFCAGFVEFPQKIYIKLNYRT
ncbi:unnamed protein product [Didymodactylos carnosus]|uniref:U-box domain-containing protein n=1 Tax=Didymodactylos carnosus TaxID=1234261 RepID=A0A8S2Z2M4_9BILA|nr:unnamed protein product [Didymodactylos carnosus]